MANGSKVYESPFSVAHTLLDAEAGATADGVWVDVGDTAEVAVHTVFSSTGTVEIHGSNANPRPTNATNGVILDTLTGNDLALAVPTPRWIKAKVTANAGTITCNIVARKPAR